MAGKRLFVLGIVLILLVAGVFTLHVFFSNRYAAEALVLATTTSTYDSGLLEFLVPHFQEQHDARVKIVAVGTGQALELGRNGDADVLLVHAPRLERDFVAQGHGLYRRDVMYNQFVIIGPEADPAGIMGLDNATEAFQRIFQNRSSVRFCSRGDDSGTHSREKELWTAAGFHHHGLSHKDNSSWYISLGQGMGDTLRTSNEMLAYTLTDEATYTAMKMELSRVTLHVRGDAALFNQYGVIPVNGTRHANVSQALASAFAEWITSPGVQYMIDSYTRDGSRLFTANAPGPVGA